MDTLRYPTLAAWAKDMGDAIRERDGTSEQISHQDMPDRVRAIPSGGSGVDLSQIQTKAENVLETETYMGSDGQMHYGTMPEIADETITLDGTDTVHNITEGHHKGGGKVQIVPDTDNSFTPSKSKQTISPASGKVFTKVILEPIPDIYVDASAADAAAAHVLSGKKFVGKSGIVEDGAMEDYSGDSLPYTYTSNGTKYIPNAGYYSTGSYFKVNVPQNITQVTGEDSTGTTAIAADIRSSKTARSKGSLVYGTMPDVEAPSIAIAKNISTVGSTRKLLLSASSAATKSGYLEKGKSSNNSLEIPIYCENNGNNMTITPGKTEQYFKTAGKYLEGNLKVEAVETSGFDWLDYNVEDIQSDSIQIPKSRINGTPFEIHINRTSAETSSEFSYVVESLYLLFVGEVIYSASGVIVSGGKDGGTAYMYKKTDDYTLVNSNSEGLIITVSNDERTVNFKGDYNVVVISEV